LFLEYEFIIVYKLGHTHVADALSRLPNIIESTWVLDQTTHVVDALSKLPDIIESTWVLDQTTHATLFMLELVWLEEVKNYM
jgi:hypothetical protein